MNTKIRYLYRDGSNCKYRDEFIVSGDITFADLKPFLDEGEWFVPGDVDLPHPGTQAEGWPGDADHPWCELDEDSFERTDEEADISAEKIVYAFRAASEADWPGQGEELE